MKNWTRTTHNFNNETREWEHRTELPEIDSKHLKSTLGIHALVSGRWMVLWEIIGANKEYYEQYKDDPYGGCHEIGHLEESVLHDLEVMEKAGWIKVKD
jgi:hypothetical protein